MTKTKMLLAGASILASGLAAAPAMAQQTASGTTVTNNVTVNYKVGGVDQTEVTANTSFTVDRKFNLTITESGNATTSVSPGQAAAVTTFVVTNSSNATLDFALSASNQSGGTAPHGGTDNFNVTGIKIYFDTNDNGSYDAGTDAEITYLDQVAAEATRRVFVVASVPIGAVNGDIAAVRLTATSHEATAASSLGAAVTQTAGANTTGVDTVFADTNSNGNTARDGIHFADDDYTVGAATLSVTKTSKIVSDPFNGTTNPKMIPGSVVEYCIIVANAANSSTATNVSISDTLPSQTTYDAAFGIMVNGTVTDGACNADGSAGGSYSSGVVSGTLSDIAAGVTRTLRFRTSVN